MFDPEHFSVAEKESLSVLCKARLRPANAYRLREGTDTEWRIIVGIAEGHLVCRRMPDFLKAVMDSKERLRLYSTVQTQEEDQLVLHLARGRTVPISKQTTHALTEMILESAELLRVSLPDVHQLLRLTKTISYNRTTRTIHFFFFSRGAAIEVQDVHIPFQGTVYTLENVHHPTRGSVWSNQRGPDGRSGHTSAEYTVYLYNLSRFNEIGRVAAYLKSKIPTEFDLEDMDTCNPNSRTSTVWKVTF